MKSKVYYTVDAVIFGINNVESDNPRLLPEKKLEVLLTKRTKEPFKDSYVLPGGYVGEEEAASTAIQRVLEKETNLKKVYMEHINVYDDIDRDNRGRTISNTYTALINKNDVSYKLSNESKWYEIYLQDSKLILICDNQKIEIIFEKKSLSKYSNDYEIEVIGKNEIGFDHSKIIVDAYFRLLNKVKTTDLIFSLMPEEFTIGELKQVYELLLGKKIFGTSFRRILESKIEKCGKIVKNGGFRPSELYRYKGE